MRIWKGRQVRCYDCGLPYKRRDHSTCPRCGETRVIRSSTWFPQLEDSFEIGEMSKAQAGHAIPDMKRREREQQKHDAQHRRPEEPESR